MRNIIVVFALLGLFTTSCASVALQAQPAGPTPAAPEQSALAITAAIETPAPVDSSILPADSDKVSFEAGPGGIKLFLEIVSVTTPVKQGETATVRVRTLPGARCTISVYYTDVRSAAVGLEEKTAEPTGNVSWTWKVGTDRTPGTFRIEITSRIGDNKVSQTTSFEVIKRP